MGCVSKELLTVLACPECKSPVTDKTDSVECTNPDCKLRYPVHDGIPVMLTDKATRSTKDDR